MDLAPALVLLENPPAVPLILAVLSASPDGGDDGLFAMGLAAPRI